MAISKIILEKYYKDKDNFQFSIVKQNEGRTSFKIIFKPLVDITVEELFELKGKYNSVDKLTVNDDLFDHTVAYMEIINDQIYLRRIKKLNKIKERLCSK